jgi:transposase
MHRHAIRDEDWDRIKDLLPGREDLPGVTAKDNRLFIDAVLWIAKTGAPWRDLPERFGNWNSAWRRFDRWARKGVWQKVFEQLKDPDLEWLMLDSTVVRAHACAAGARKGADGTGGQEDQALGRSRGGFGTKIHIAVDGLGNPVRFSVTAGQVGDLTQAEGLLEGLEPGAVIADKGYDSDKFVAKVESVGAEVVIPPLGCRKVLREYDEHLYKERNKAERFIGLIKQYRRVATRYEKTARNFLAFVHVAAIVVLLR